MVPVVVQQRWTDSIAAWRQRWRQSTGRPPFSEQAQVRTNSFLLLQLLPERPPGGLDSLASSTRQPSSTEGTSSAAGLSVCCHSRSLLPPVIGTEKSAITPIACFTQAVAFDACDSSRTSSHATSYNHMLPALAAVTLTITVTSTVTCCSPGTRPKPDVHKQLHADDSPQPTLTHTPPPPLTASR
jgi:hypothetical protein